MHIVTLNDHILEYKIRLVYLCNKAVIMLTKIMYTCMKCIYIYIYHAHTFTYILLISTYTHTHTHTHCWLQNNWDFLNGSQRLSSSKLVQKPLGQPQLFCNGQYIYTHKHMYVHTAHQFQTKCMARSETESCSVWAQTIHG